MDSCCATLKANALPVKVGGGLRNQSNGFWGERIKSRDSNTQLFKSVKSERKIKSGVVHSILTSPDINQDNVVSLIHGAQYKHLRIKVLEILWFG